MGIVILLSIIAQAPDDSCFEIVLAKAGQKLERGLSQSELLSEVQWQATPVLTMADVYAYRWGDHQVTIREEAVMRLPELDDMRDFRLFKVTSAGRDAYVGAFVTSRSRLNLALPVIRIQTSTQLFIPKGGGVQRGSVDASVIRKMNSRLRIEGRFEHGEAADPRSKDWIYACIKASGKMTQGI